MSNETNDPQSDATVIKELTRLADSAVPVIEAQLDDGRRFIARRNDFIIEQITLPGAAKVLPPQIVTANVAIDTAASLIDYVKRFKNPNTMLFAHEQTATIVAVIDYHAAADADGKVTPNHAQQIATLTLRQSDEWKLWTSLDEKLMRHVDFATFLEEQQFDITKPVGAELLEICRDLQVKVDMEFGSSIRMGDSVQINYQKGDNVGTKGTMSLPVNFETTIPVFFGEPAVKVNNWTRRKVADGELLLGYKMAQRPQTVAREFARIVSAVQAGVGLTIIHGKK